MDDVDILPWLKPLIRSTLVWYEVGSAGGIRATSQQIAEDGHAIECVNLVTACALAQGKVFHSGEYSFAAEAIHMPDDIASALSRAGDNNLPSTHKYYAALTALVDFLTHGGNLLKD